MASLAEDRRALALFFVSRASVQNLNPFVFAALWLKSNSNNTVTTNYGGDYTRVYALLRFIAERGNPYGAISVRLLCYDCDNILRDIVGDINAMMGSTRYIVEGCVHVALTAGLLPGDGPPKWLSLDHTSTHVVDTQGPSTLPWAVDGYYGCAWLKKDGSLTSYWDMINAQVDDLTTAFVPFRWTGIGSNTEVGGAVGTGFTASWTDDLLTMVKEGFYNCISKPNQPNPYHFYINGRRSKLDQLCTPYQDGHNAALPTAMLPAEFGGTVTVV